MVAKAQRVLLWKGSMITILKKTILTKIKNVYALLIETLCPMMKIKGDAHLTGLFMLKKLWKKVSKE